MVAGMRACRLGNHLATLGYSTAPIDDAGNRMNNGEMTPTMYSNCD